VDVVLVRWPGEDGRRQRLENDRIPRLLLVDPDAEPPLVHDDLEDWIRMPADQRDVRARVDALMRRGAMALPAVDGDGVVRFNGVWVAVPPLEARILGPMVERFETVVTRDAVTRAAWPDGAPGRNALDVHILRLRRRLETVGLAIRTIRSRGFLLEGRSDSGQKTDVYA
jgi:two-component system OmpR family response regulator